MIVVNFERPQLPRNGMVLPFLACSLLWIH